MKVRYLVLARTRDDFGATLLHKQADPGFSNKAVNIGPGEDTSLLRLTVRHDAPECISGIWPIFPPPSYLPPLVFGDLSWLPIAQNKNPISPLVIGGRRARGRGKIGQIVLIQSFPRQI